MGKQHCQRENPAPSANTRISTKAQKRGNTRLEERKSHGPAFIRAEALQPSPLSAARTARLRAAPDSRLQPRPTVSAHPRPPPTALLPLYPKAAAPATGTARRPAGSTGGRSPRPGRQRDEQPPE